MKSKLKKCRVCKTEFFQYTSTQVTCSIKCAIEYAREQEKKKDKSAARRQKKEYYDNDRKYQLKLAQKACNEYIRARDGGLGCISCDKPNDGTHQRHASHYRPGTNRQLMFNELNIHASCQQCNTTKSGNLTEYRIRLIQKIGIEKVEWLESYQGDYKFTLDDIKEIKQFYKEKVKLLIMELE